MEVGRAQANGSKLGECTSRTGYSKDTMCQVLDIMEGVIAMRMMELVAIAKLHGCATG